MSNNKNKLSASAAWNDASRCLRSGPGKPTASDRGEDLYRDLVEQVDAITNICHPWGRLSVHQSQWLAQPSTPAPRR